ncbi:alpha/beta fold hydrolase [Leucobacter allii]|uniref:Alpha/beta fold hydrolase n=1 Tax=Leucobacter allii TaxID=2932247 RepID=A0ABY4FQQ1_9MICO|nr:alpha/beta fold hydrolase [Leucobacter allii]UOQ58606.1 alpha/beta fold hydrolase [Leucobacter allii]
MTGRDRGRAIGIGAAWLALAATAGAGLAVLGGVALARRAVTPAAVPEAPVRVLAVLERDGAAHVRLRGTDAGLPGRYSLVFDGGAGHARLGAVVAGAADSAGGVLRELVAVDRGTLVPGTTGRITGWWFADAAELGYRTERIAFPTELGEAEAWLVHPKRARKRRWAVHVHGRGADPVETLRGVAPLARAGITSLVISYRNDTGAPSGRHARYGLGVSESRDVDAAVAEAVRRGAGRVTLVGWSMGATACLLAASGGEHRSVVDGLILDSPAIDWEELLRYHAAGMRVPRRVAGFGVRLLDAGLVRAGEDDGIPFDRLEASALGRALTVPVLIHASRADTFVPCAGAERLAAARPELVQLRLQDRGEHVKLWNVDPAPWERSTEAFARALPHPPWRG